MYHKFCIRKYTTPTKGPRHNPRAPTPARLFALTEELFGEVEAQLRPLIQRVLDSPIAPSELPLTDKSADKPADKTAGDAAGEAASFPIEAQEQLSKLESTLETSSEAALEANGAAEAAAGSKRAAAGSEAACKRPAGVGAARLLQEGVAAWRAGDAEKARARGSKRTARVAARRARGITDSFG